LTAGHEGAIIRDGFVEIAGEEGLTGEWPARYILCCDDMDLTQVWLRHNLREVMCNVVSGD